MLKQKSAGLFAAVFCFSFFLSGPGELFARIQKLTPAEVIARHLKSIGKADDRAKIRSRGFSGRASVQFLQGSTGNLNDGTFLFVSEGSNVGMSLKFKELEYPGEYFAYNGKEATVADVTPGQRSPLADFMFRYNVIMKSGLWGGVLSVGWPLLDYEKGPADEFLYRQEKVNGKYYHVLEYGPGKRLKDLKVTLYFDPATFHHVRTVYSVRHKNDASSVKGVTTNSGVTEGVDTSVMPNRIGDLQPRATIHQDEPDSIYRLVENFDRFANVGGLVLPQSYSIEYSVEGHGASFLAVWTILAEHWMNNGKVDQNFFVAQK